MLTGWRLALSKLFIIPQRYVLSIMALLAIANAYTMRVCLNLAITQMVKKNTASEGDPHYDPFACPEESSGNETITRFFRVKEEDVSSEPSAISEFDDSLYLVDQLD